MKKFFDMILRPVEPGKASYFNLVLRGISQICFQTNELTGLFFLIAVLIASPISCAYLIVAALLAPAGRKLLGEREAVLTTGLPGLNPCLIALSLPSFFQTSWNNIGMWLVLIVCIVSTIVLVRLCVAILPFPPLALPFLIIFWALYALASKLDVLQPLPLSKAIPRTLHPITAILCSLGQPLYASNIWSGLLFLVGLLLSNWRHGFIAFAGAVIGTVMSSYDHTLESTSADLGLYGFNSVLTAVSVFVFCGGKLRLSLFGAILSTLFIPEITRLGVQTLSSPFVFTTWLMLGLGWIEENWFNERPPTQPKSKRDTDNRQLRNLSEKNICLL